MNTEIVQLRHKFHQYPELSNKEFKTAELINKFMQENSPDKEYRVGSTGRLFVYESGINGPVTVFRADMDALPIQETGDVVYKSTVNGVGHMCGHDGHMSILLGLAKHISTVRPQSGTVALLFQPAEECEQGAADVVAEHVFKALVPDMIFGIHNIPGFVKNSVIVKQNTFAAASKGMVIKLFGKTSHAAEPEKGINPAQAISEIVSDFNHLCASCMMFEDMVNLTVVNIQLGEIAFGTSPGYGEIRVTLRAYRNGDMKILTNECEDIISVVCEKERLRSKVYYVEDFPATVNNDSCNKLIINSAKDNNFKVVTLEQPNSWSEDFGYYTNVYKGGFFGIGAGINHAALHNSDYDFPDEIIETGISMLFTIYKKRHG